MGLQRRLQVVTPPVTETAAMSSPAPVLIAFASTDLKRVDQHFGSAQCLAIYRLEGEGSALVEAVQFGMQARDGHEDKLMAKFDALQGCAAVYCEAAGASAVKQLLALGVQPLKVAHGTRIGPLLGELQDVIRDGCPPPWLAKAMQQGRSDPDRFDAMAAEPWEEEA
ncbi:NifB/NifX family molybdenum-iron cluster-binding protein [Ectothiorhodospira shaposhnikovii]|uniref:NifB/NifX family molybdenum-iron cluster-binding protein n=1 Tax=Ectothiorhodospira shaposhnikovii TaxID=1054 RepID=UPI001F5BF91B|nr:NifB/NifX family molybdenum-iron cluster-binding protein [Ectothiorhodospira shaposhnikovii]